jgi:trimeric autotransporter adhesin
MNAKTSTIVFLYRTAAALVIVMLALAVLPVAPAYAAACTFTSNVATSGNWSSPVSWIPTGTGCGQYPGAGFSGDIVVISDGDTITLDVSPANPIASLTFPTDNAAPSTVSFNAGTTLNVSETVTIPRAESGAKNTLDVGAGTLNVQGDLAFTNSLTTVRHQLTISTGTVTVAGDVTVDTPGNTSPTISFSGAGLLRLGGGLWSGGGGTLTLFAGSTVEYNGAGAQTVKPLAYSNLTLSGADVKSLPALTSVTGTLRIITGTSKASIAAGQILSVNSLMLGGLGRINGTWGSTSSAATYQNDTYFAATTGYLNVATDTRATPTVTTWPTASGITFGQALSDSTFTGGSASVAGAFAFTDPTIEPNAGTYSAAVTFTPSDLTSYTTVSGNVDVPVAKANATITVTPYSVTYDASAHTATGTATGVNGEDLSANLDLSGTTHTNAGNYTTDPWVFTSPNANYNNANGMVSDTIAKANATITVTPYDVTYDETAHTATGTATGVGGVDLSAGLNLSGTTHTNAGTYNNDPWTFSDASGNYNDASGTVSDNIAKADATITVTPYSVTYDGMAHTSTGTATGIGGENLASGLNLSGTTHTNAGNYLNDPWTFTSPNANYNNASGTVSNNIAKANANIVVTPYNVTYDGLAHTATGTATGVTGEDLASGLDLSGTTHINAGTYNNDPWNFTAPNGNYNNANGTVNDSITAATLTITGLTANDKVYDGNNTATLSGMPVLVGVISGDIVNLAGTPVATFADANVGTNKPVTVTGFTLSGADADNYTVTQPTGLTASITAAPLTVTGITASNKVYNGNRSATLNTAGATLVGVLPGDNVQLDTSSATGLFDDKNVGTGKTVTINGLALTGPDAGKYVITPPTTTADITPKPLTVTATAANKVYDGTTAATVTLSATPLLGDTVTLAYTSADFADPNVGTGKTVTVSGISLGGTDGGNYSANATATATADITQAPLTVTADDQTKTVGQPDPPFTFTYSGFVNGETGAVIDTPPTCAVSVPHDSVGTYPIVCSGGADDNYSLSYVDGTLTVTPVAVGQTFDDVPTDYWAWEFIERLYAAGITSGCSTSPPQYCPEDTVTRAQMAVFLERGIHGASYVPPDVGSDTGFGDVPTDYWAAAFIKQLVVDGITVGCGNGNYCPEDAVTRAQMAVFLLRAKHGASYVPPDVGSDTGFGDVPTDYWAAAFIKQLVAEGITVGCGNGNYCPEAPLTRAEMAVFLVRTFGLP